MVVGRSGSGKSTSLRNFEKDEVGVISCAGKRLPFPKDLGVFKCSDYKTIEATILSGARNAYIIDDSTYLMQFQMFAMADKKGYDKFTTMASNFEHLLEVVEQTDDDTIVYFLHHPQFDDSGTFKPQTIGKMLDNQLNIEGLFNIVIEARVEDGKHVFYTNSDGVSIAKSPMGMFDNVIDNDLKYVDTRIREYWNMEPLSKKALCQPWVICLMNASKGLSSCSKTA